MPDANLDYDSLEFHPLADIFPLIDDEELTKLSASLEKNRLRKKIVLYEDKILDGRNRYRAAQQASLTLTERNFIAFDGDDPLEYVLDANLVRRHLDESQRAMIAAKLATLKKGRPNRPIGLSTPTQAQAAKRLNVSVRTVKRARVVREHASPETIAAVEAGKLSVNKAATAVRPKAVKHGVNRILVRQIGVAEVILWLATASEDDRRKVQSALEPLLG